MDALDLAARCRRLERLRHVRRPSEATITVPPPRHTVGRAPRLADAVGGRVEHHAGGSVVVLEASGRLAVARDVLARLPDPVKAGHPLVCLDTETTGLGTGAGTMPFLVGIGTWTAERFTVRQFFLPDHADEPALLAAIAAAIPADAWLVTYNGRSFDWPLLVTRYRLHRHDPPEHAGHLDLLTLARQMWRHRLPDARLASVEAGVCGVRRVDDLPGALIPALYFDFLRSGRCDVLLDVVQHNRQDVASLARLLAWLGRGLDPTGFGDTMHPGDLAGLGRAYVRRRRYTDGLACFDAALRSAPNPDADGPWVSLSDERTVADRARVLARMGRSDEAAAQWLQLAQRGGVLATLGWIQVAKHREHRLRDITGALDATERALRLASRSRLLGQVAPWMARDLDHRLARLRRLALRQSRFLQPRSAA